MSQPVTFEPGVQYLFQGRGYQVVQVLSDGMLIARNIETNALISQQLTELWRHWQENTLEFAREGANLNEQGATPSRPPLPFPILRTCHHPSRRSHNIAIN